VAFAILPGQHGELAAHHAGIQRLIALRSEHLREVRRLDLAQHHVAVVTASGPPRR